MGDALCGPSNALQNFQKHASVDRTLQQDRLISRQSPSQVSRVSQWRLSTDADHVQGFRSQNLQEGALDPEFAAFEGNFAGHSAPDFQPGPSVTPSRQLPVPNHPGNANWAADFQRLQISSPSGPESQHQSPFAPPAAFASPSAAPSRGWQDEFLQHHQQAPVQNHPHYDQGFRPSFARMYPPQGAMSTFQPPQESVSASQGPADTFDESAFEAAFEQAREDMDTQAADTTPHDLANIEAEQTPAIAAEPQETPRIGSDTIPVTEDRDLTNSNDADELAKTAGHLLDSVRHDQSQKFQGSNFLALMRRIRDREIQVEGDEFREVSTSSS